MCSKLNKRENKRKALPKKENSSWNRSTCNVAIITVVAAAVNPSECARAHIRFVYSVVAMKAMDPFNEERVLLCFRLIFFTSFFLPVSFEYS